MTPYTVAELTQQLETLIGDITPEPVAVRGTLTTWQSSKAWQRGELVTHVDNSIAARITLGCTARHGKAIAWALAVAGYAIEPPATDIIVIVRGGGATSDLHVWDNEAIATAIALCNTPVIVGVGHATDQHIARRVAWHGANTPTAAAQKLADTIRPTPAPVATARNPNITPAAIRASPAPLRGHIDPVPIRSPNRLKWALTAALIVTAVLFSYWLGQQT